MKGTIVGRPSQKRQRIFDVYRLLRCAMTSDDIQELLNRHPGFSDMTMGDTDVNILESIFHMTEAMAAISPIDLLKAEPLRR